jgi:hypothetical protein
MILSSYSQQKINTLGMKNNYPSLLPSVVKAIDEGKAMVFEHKNIGCVVTKPIIIDDKFGMLVWVAIGYCKDAIKKYLPFFVKMARRSGMKFIEFQTKRKGFKRLAPKFNFKEARPCDGFFVFRKEV